MSWVNMEYLDEPAIGRLSKDFPKAKPFPHMVLHEFFSPGRLKKLRNELLKQSFAFKESDLFRLHQTADISTLPNKVLRGFYDFFNSGEFTSYISKITKTKVSSADMSGFIYSSTDHLLPHDDRLEGRKIAYIVQLSENFTKNDGGALSLFASKNNRPAKVAHSFTPKFNSLVLFRVSPKSFHQVDEVLTDKKRLSLAGWFY